MVYVAVAQPLVKLFGAGSRVKAFLGSKGHSLLQLEVAAALMHGRVEAGHTHLVDRSGGLHHEARLYHGLSRLSVRGRLLSGPLLTGHTSRLLNVRLEPRLRLLLLLGHLHKERGAFERHLHSGSSLVSAAGA